MVLFSSLVFEAHDVELALDRIDEIEASKEERDHYRRSMEPLRRRVGQVAWLRLAYHYEGRWLAYERLAFWYGEYRNIMMEMDALFPDFDPDDEDDDNGSPGYFSPN